MTLRICPKTKASVCIELDGSIRGTLPLRALPQSLPSGFEGEIAAEQSEALLQQLREYAFNLLLDYLAAAEHSEWQCRSMLRRRQFDASLSQNAIDRCKELNYLDNARFSELLINSWIARLASKRAIIAKLREQRIRASVWQPLLEELYPRELASDNIVELLRKFCVAHRDLPRPKLREKAFTYLYRKGFDLDAIQSAWSDLD